MKTISFGGLGDCINVFCKLSEMKWPIDHLFVESNSKTLELIEEFKRNFLYCPFVNSSYKEDEDYYENFLRGKWRDRRPINTSWDGKYDFPYRDNLVCEQKLTLKRSFNPSNNRIVIQSYGGVNKSRHWKFPLISLEKALSVSHPDHEIIIIGNELSLSENIELVLNSHVFIGLSGFHNYLRTNQGFKNVMLEESEQHTRHYIRESDRNSGHLKIIKYGSIQEILTATKELIND